MQPQPDNNHPNIYSANVVGEDKKQIISISIALGLIITGGYPAYVLLSTLDNPSIENTVIAWLAMSFTLIWGVCLAVANIKVKGYQQDSIRIFGVATFFAGIILFFIPVVASVLFATGIGK